MTPQSLLNQKQLTNSHNYNDLYNIINKSIKNNDKNGRVTINNNTRLILKRIVDTINITDFDPLIDLKQRNIIKHSMTVDVEDLKLKDTDIKEIETDFGEIIGPLIILKSNSDYKVEFAKSKNTYMLDYVIIDKNDNKIDCSAKGGSTGGHGSAGQAIEIMNALKNETNISIISKFFNMKDIKTYKDLQNELDTKDKNIKNIFELFQFYTSEYRVNNMLKQQIFLIQNFSPELLENTANDDILPICNILKNLSINNVTYKEIINNVNTFVDTNKDNITLKLLFEALYSTRTDVDDLVEQWSDTSIKLSRKCGIILYPFYVNAINNINTIAGNKTSRNNLITDICRMLLQLKTVYTTVRFYQKPTPTIKILLEIHDSREPLEGGWIFDIGQMSRSTMNKNKIQIKHVRNLNLALKRDNKLKDDNL